jgi:hypothetical protein
LNANLFPHLPPPLEASLFAGLAPAPEAALDPSAWTPAVARRIARRRLSEHGLWVARRYSIDLPPEARAMLEDAAHEEALLALRLRSIGADLQRVLADDGIDSLGIKGAAVVDLHGDELPRFYGDVDLLVPPRDFTRAVSVYERAGFRPAGVTPWSRRFGGSANLTMGAGREVDVQRVIRPWCWGGRITFDALRARSRTVNGMTVLGLADALIGSSIAQIADTRTNTWKIVPWRDLVLLASAADAAEVASIARRGRLSALVVTALAALPTGVRPEGFVAALGPPADMSLPTRLRFAAFAHSGWTENWFVQIMRELPAWRIPLAVAAVPFLPPAEMSTIEWWRHATKVFERRRAARAQ